MRRAAIALGLGIALAPACEEHRHVNLLFGPDEQTLSRGYKCLEEDGVLPMARRGFSANGTLEFQLVIDFIDMGGVPSCRGEEILTWCQDPDHACEPLVLPERYCKTVTLAGFTLGNLRDQLNEASLVPRIYDQIRTEDGGLIIADAPDVPVLVRAVATTQPCSELTTPINGHYPPFDTDNSVPMDAKLIGCAFSCPVLLDQVDGDVELGFDSLEPRCEPAVQVCAGDLSP